MKLYFVRHGESEANILNIYQVTDSTLSSYGKEQVKILAKRFLRIPIDVIISSDFKRAKQTAEILNKVIEREIIYTPLLRERKMASEIIGRSYKDIEALNMEELRKQYANDSL